MGKHCAWMKTFSAGSTEFVISCYVSQAKEPKEFTDPSMGFTDNMLFTIDEEFTNMDAVMRHVENAKKNDYFADFGKILMDYGKVPSMGGSNIFAFREGKGVPQPVALYYMPLAGR